MLKISLLLFVYKCNCYTVIIGTGGTSDTMHIVFTIMRNIKVYHQTNIININPPGHNISCYQNIDSTRLKFMHDKLSLGLFKVRVHLPNI